MHTAKITRERLIEHLHAKLEAEPWVLAAWLGGSEASGRVDELSDIDLQLLIEDERVEACFECVVASLEELSPISSRFRIPEPAWHGLSQEFFALRDASADHVLDLAIVRRSLPPDKRFLERERHGVARVLFDRTGEIVPRDLDRIEHLAKLQKRFKEVRAQFEVLQPVITRAARRDFPLEAASFYQRLALQPLVELLRMRHAPLVYDYGLRYLDRDLPSPEREFVEQRAFPSDLDELERMRGELVERFRAELSAFDAGEWQLET